MPRLGLVLAAALLLAGCASAADRPPARPPQASVAASSWSQASGSPGRTSPAKATGPHSARIAWRRTLEGAVVPGAAIGIDGSILQASNGGVLHALDPATGKDRWTYDGSGTTEFDVRPRRTVAAEFDIRQVVT